MDWQSALKMKIIKHFSDIISGSDNICTSLFLVSPGVSWIRMVPSAPLYRSPNYQKRPLLDVPRECFFFMFAGYWYWHLCGWPFTENIYTYSSEGLNLCGNSYLKFFSLGWKTFQFFIYFFIKNGTQNFSCDFNHYFSWFPTKKRFHITSMNFK